MYPFGNQGDCHFSYASSVIQGLGSMVSNTLLVHQASQVRLELVHLLISPLLKLCSKN